MGGRIAEEMFMHHITTGAGNDIERATDMARKMVCEWGMSELGPLSFGKREEQIFLGREIAQHRDYSEETAIRIDEQVKKLVQRATIARARSSKIARTRWSASRWRLLEREVLDGAEVRQLIDGEKLAAVAASSVEARGGETQQVIKPNASSVARAGMLEGGPQPA